MLGGVLQQSLKLYVNVLWVVLWITSITLAS